MLSVLPDKIGKAFGNSSLSIYSSRNNKLAELINSKYTEDLVEAIRILYCQYLQNKDLTLYMSRIIIANEESYVNFFENEKIIEQNLLISVSKQIIFRNKQ